MIAVILAAALAFSVALNVGFILLLNEQREKDRLRLAAMRGMRRRIAHQEELLAGTERAVEVAREVLGLPDESTPIHDLLAEEREQHEAQVLQFRQQMNDWKGGA